MDYPETNVACETDRPRTARVLGMPEEPPRITRARLKELFALAYETVAFLESKGLKRGEQCEFRQIAENIWFKD